MLLTIYALGNELKRNISRVLLRMSNNKMFVALFAKMFPHTLIYCTVITLIDVILYKFMQFPCAVGVGSMLAASYSLIIASQSLAIFLFGLLPIMRLSLSAASLISVVSLSISGFTFPVSEMHYVLQCWSNFFPLRHFFLLYVDQALNGLGFEYTWHIYLALALFLFLPLIVMKSIKRVYLTYKYIP
jgi:ABC-2 type transport system permease protein